MNEDKSLKELQSDMVNEVNTSNNKNNNNTGIISTIRQKQSAVGFEKRKERDLAGVTGGAHEDARFKMNF